VLTAEVVAAVSTCRRTELVVVVAESRRRHQVLILRRRRCCCQSVEEEEQEAEEQEEASKASVEAAVAETVSSHQQLDLTQYDDLSHLHTTVTNMFTIAVNYANNNNNDRSHMLRS